MCEVFEPDSAEIRWYPRRVDYENISTVWSTIISC